MRREPLLAGLLCLVGAFLVLVAAGRVWVVLDLVQTPLLPPQGLAVTGGDLLPGLSALGLAGLAGVLALAATRGRGRLLVGAVLLAVGGSVAALVLRLALDGLARAARRTEFVRGAGGDIASTSTSPWPWVCLLGGLLLAMAGLLVAVRGRRWAALGRRYEAPVAQPAPQPDAPVADRDLWEALDRGDDPTQADPEAGRPAPRG